MSFILDALKKSESDRQRKSGPALFEVKVASPRTHLPPWAIAIAALLVVNLGIVTWLVLRHGAHAAATSAAVPAVNPPAPPGSAPAAAATAVSPAVVTSTVPLANVATAPAAGAPEKTNPEDEAPAAPAGQATGSHVRRGTASGVPLYQEAAATPGTTLPQLRLDLHAYAEQPRARFVMINMQKLHEGDVLPDGVHVDEITPEGAVLSYKGARFLLPRD